MYCVKKGNYFQPVTQCSMVLRSRGNAMNTRHGVPGEPAPHAVICDRLHNSFLTPSASKPWHGASQRAAATEGPAANFGEGRSEEMGGGGGLRRELIRWHNTSVIRRNSSPSLLELRNFRTIITWNCSWVTTYHAPCRLLKLTRLEGLPTPKKKKKIMYKIRKLHSR